MKLDELLAKGALAAAPKLLGMTLVHVTPLGRISGRITEVEAYTQDDPASHSFVGQTRRNAAMFAAPGTIYVYFIYGAHYCVNIVCGPVGAGEAVLIRALEPREGIAQMKQHRHTADLHNLTNGPAKLVQALGITKELNGTLITDGPLRLEPGDKIPVARIQTSPRIGITKAIDRHWRFYVLP